MKLYKKNQYYIVETPNVKKEVIVLGSRRGLAISVPASTKATAVMFSNNPYAVADIENDIAELRPYSNAIAESQERKGVGTLRLPMGKELWPYQKAALDYILKRGGGLIASEMGLGKTPMAIAFCNEVEAQRILVIVPAALRLQWKERIEEWSVIAGLRVAAMMNKKDGIHPLAHYQIISYQAARDPVIIKAIAKYQWDVLVLDEVHACKTIDAITTRAIFGNSKNMFVHGKEKISAISTYCNVKIGLTGTPILNRPSEAFTLIRFFDHELIDFIGWEQFKEKYNRQAQLKTPTGKRFSIESVSLETELQNRLRVGFMSRHMKKDVFPDMKPPKFDIVRVEKDHAVAEALEAESLLNIDIESAGINFDEAGHVAEVRRLMGEAIAPHVADYAKVFLDGSAEKLVIFAWHISVLNILQDALKSYGVERIDGSKSSLMRKKSLDNFIKNNNVRTLIGNMQSMGTGIDGLQEVCSRCYIAEPDWVPAQNMQAVGRLDRIGQKEIVTAEIFVAPGSISERILIKMLEKMKTIDLVLNKKRNKP